MEVLKTYWSDGDFDLDGKQFRGYADITPGGAAVRGSGEPLEPRHTWASQFNLTGESFDRTLDEELSLPHGESEVTLQANDFLDRRTVRAILERLQENNAYLYRKAHAASTAVPAAENAVAYGTDGTRSAHALEGSALDPESFPPTSSSDAFYGDGHFPLDGIVKMQARVLRTGVDRYGSRRVKLAVFVLFRDSLYIIRHVYHPDFVRAEEYTDGAFCSFLAVEGHLPVDRTSFSPEEEAALRRLLVPAGADPEEFLKTLAPDGADTSKTFDLDRDKAARALHARMPAALAMLKDEPIHLRGRSYAQLAELWTTLHAKPIELSKALPDARGDYVRLDRLEPSNPSSLHFKGLCDAKLDGNLLYLADRDLDIVACYNLSLLYDGDADWSIRLARLQETMQGRGGASDKACFKGPRAVAVAGGRVYVADGGNRAVKVYTRGFDYVRSIRDASFLTCEVDDMVVNPYPCDIDGIRIAADSVWVLSHTTNHAYLSILSDGLVAYNTEVHHVELGKWEGPRPEPLCLAFSQADSQYLYLATSGAVYKLYASRPSEPFASFTYGDPSVDVDERLWQFTEAPWSRAGFPWSSDVTDALSSTRLWTRGFCLCCADSPDACEVQAGDPVRRVPAAVEGDIVLHAALAYNPRKASRAMREAETDDFDALDAETVRGLMGGAALMLYREPSRYDSLLDAEGTPCFTAGDIGCIGEDECVDAMTFNRLMYKVAYNAVRLKGIVRYRMRAYYGADHLLHADGVEPAPKADVLRAYSWHNFFIGDNEPVSVVVNRAMLAVLDVQGGILDTLRTREVARPSRQKDILMLR